MSDEANPCRLDVLRRLETTILERKATADAATSHTARLLAAGAPKCAQKFGEEAVETVIAALEESESQLADEAADTLYHLLVLLAARGVSFDAVLAVLESREGVSGIAEKAGRVRAD
ncbi:MAG: phosphoribosyl-ATP diphosphatase [Pseudomonadota bacterium]